MTDLVYILGLGHSGSTLLDMVLGSHPKMFSLGEIFDFDRGIASDMTCTCGELIPQCEFWSQVLRQVDFCNGFKTDLLEPDVTAVRGKAKRKLTGLATNFLLPPAVSRSLIKMVRPDIWQRVVHTHQLYEASRAISQKPILIDSSKSARRAKILNAFLPEAMRVVYLTRDGRAWFDSQLKRSPLSPEQLAKRWVQRMHEMSQTLRTLPPKSYLHVRYEQMCREPEQTFQMICEFIGVPYIPEMLAFRDGTHHNIGGNPMRLQSESRIVENTHWRENLPEDLLRIFETHAGALNKEVLGTYYVR